MQRQVRILQPKRSLTPYHDIIFYNKSRHFYSNEKIFIIMTYGSYGSYSSMSSVTQPLDIGSGSYLSRTSWQSSSCAYPSWPRGSSLGSSPEQQEHERASSYLSDDDLFVCDVAAEDDGHSSMSGASSNASASPFATEQDMLELQQQQMAMQREAIKMLVQEKERRRQAFKKSRARTSYTKKSKSKKNDMAPITEGGE